MSEQKEHYGCHVELFAMEDDYEPDGCVLVDGVVTGHCIYAKPGMKPDDCKYWRVITPESIKDARENGE